jgi:signal transduction histidine kinase
MNSRRIQGSDVWRADYMPKLYRRHVQGALVIEGKGVIDILIQDTGIGIKGEELKRIFNPFEQVENVYSRRFSGTGLGLSLTKRLVELQGGRIWAESEGEGKGSKFIFVIPA